MPVVCRSAICLVALCLGCSAATGQEKATPEDRAAIAKCLDKAKKDKAGAETCITGNGVRMMVRLGYLDDPRIQRGIEWLVSAQKSDGGWHCWRSRTGTLAAWEAMAAFAVIPPARRTASVVRAIERGAEFFLERGLLRETDGSSYRPWWRIHYPNHYYYDFLVGLDFLTALGYGSDARLRPVLKFLEGKRGRDGCWRLDCVQPDLEASDPYHHPPPVYPVLLEYPGEPSQWATLVALRVLRRAGRCRELPQELGRRPKGGRTDLDALGV